MELAEMWFIKKNEKKYLILVLLILSATILYMNKNKRDEIVFANYGSPFSSDPLDFDYYVHHYAFSSVYARLVSVEKSGTITAELAKSWENYNNFKTWRFELRDNLKYSNGETIKGQDVLLNFKRLLYLSRKNNSKSGMLEFIEDCDLDKSLISNCNGIKLEQNVLEFTFSKPMKNLLELISFGLYGLAHPSLYDHQTGIWIDKRKVISSSHYNVKIWSDKDFVLTLRPDSILNSESDVIKNVRIINLGDIKEAKDLDSVDLLFADKSSLLVDNRFQFIGSSLNLKIGYLKVNSWNNNKSELSKIEVRKWLRSKFFRSLSHNGLKITKTFLPTSLKGVNEIDADVESEKPKFKDFSIDIPEIRISGKLKENDNKKSMADIFKDAYQSLEDTNVKVKFSEKYDLEILGTGIEAKDYMDTVRFMFLSNEGIKLPDLTGKIYLELKKENPSISIINQEIWDQAVIWPIRHYTAGYWFKNDSEINININMINVDSPSIDFQFVRWK